MQEQKFNTGGIREFGSIINGQEVVNDRWIEVFNPYTGKLVGRVASLDPLKLPEVVESTYNTRIQLSRYERNKILNKMADAIEDRVDEISMMI
ncbi:MAG: aldehyde dehydrogenase family protein, partial [Cyclobacteriaceae bacterium]|nr:aldehyde dehydrogenase family protein [Cyclobacteriaceae bacterium]